MADVTERWSGRAGYVQGVKGNRAWDIDGDDVTNEEEARAALLAAYPDAGQNGVYPLDASLVGETVPKVDPTGPASWIAKQTYSVPPNGQFVPVEGDPLRRKPKLFWRGGDVEEESDVDANGVLITDAAGTPFEPRKTLRRRHRFFTMTRWESFYDIAKAEQYENTVNDAPVLIPRTPGPVAAGRVMLLNYAPMEGYTEDDTRLPCQYDFELWRGTVQDDDGLWDSFKFRILSQGYIGWYDDDGTRRRGRIVFKNGLEVPGPVRIDGQGRPIGSEYRIRDDRNGGGTLHEPAQVPPEFEVPAELQELTNGTTFLKFARAAKKPFAGLNLF